jgi:hypothetical protein
VPNVALANLHHIAHADIDFLPHGHEGFEVPHYDMHFYVVGHPEDREITCQP